MSDLSRPIADSVAWGAGVAAPAAAASVASVGVLTAGVYKVSVVTQNAGTAETTAAGIANMGLYVGATLKTPLASTTGTARQDFDRVTLDGASALLVKALAASVAGSLYMASIVATRLAQ